MCGIVGYVGGREACPVLLKGLHRLEYRGYDSAGVAMVGKDGALNVYKCKGKVSDLEHFLEGKELGGSIGIAHTRWATHGVPNDVNAHPHYSESENIALIHNGIIENYRVLKDALEENGYTFRSSTDSEVLVNLIEYIRTTGGCTLLEAVQQALRQVVGAYAIAVIEKGNRDEIIAARQSSPMAIGIGEGEFFLSSDAASVIEYTQDFVYVNDGETKLEKLTVPANVKFDAEAVYSDKLTLEWDEVPGAASYTVAWWADGTEEKDATVAEGITSASYLLKELEAGTEYHAKVKACRYNNPGYDSDYSAVVSQKTDIAPVQAGIVVSKVLATSSTLTVEWARADGQACVNSSAQVYHVKLYSDAECKDLFVGWNASNVFGITAGNRFRFTFSGLAPATTYYVCVDDKTNDFFSDPLAYATAAAGPQAGATAPGSAKAGDILLAEDFSKVIHGGDIANFAAGYYPPSSNRGTYAAASGDNPSGFSATRCTANEFDLFSGGGVAAPYTEGTGLSAWGKSGNIAGRPGYVKMGAGSAAASLYTPELTALPDAATVKVRFSAQAYSEKYDGSGADAGKILVKAVRGAVLGAKGAITGTVTEVSAADPVDISAAKARFREFEATLTNVTPDCRIVISTSEKRALLDNVVVTCTAITPATKPAAPGGVSFDAAAAADRLTLKWNAVPDATSYTVAYWKGSASAPESEYAYKTGIASTATSQELTNLESNTSYWAKVKAVGSLDSDWSETANATTMDSGGEPLLPTADLLDVVFRNDGSAMDNSSSATPVRRMPSSRP